MKKVVICPQEQEVPEICHTEIKLYRNMIVAEDKDSRYLLSLLPAGGANKCYWKSLNNSSQNWGGEYATPQEAIENERGCFEAIYSFNNLDEFVKFYQEKSNGN